MKKIALFILVLATTIFTSCSKDDNSSPISKEEEQQPNELVLSTSLKEIMIGDEISFSVNSKGTVITDAIIKHKQGEALKSYKFLATEEGNFTFVATKEGYTTSNELVVVVNKKTDKTIKGKGEFNYKDKTYSIDTIGFSYEGIFNLGERGYVAIWMVTAVNYQSGLTVYNLFGTPATKVDGEDKYDIIYPTKLTDTSSSTINIYNDAGRSIAFSNQNLEIIVDLKDTDANKPLVTGSISTKHADINGSPFSLTYTGEYHNMMVQQEAE